MEDTFYAYHPVVNFIYFVAVIGFTMFFMHPVCLGISLTAALAYTTAKGGRAGIRFIVTYMLPMIVLVMFINPAFNHAGMTILTYLPSGNPLTLESIVYGGAAACLLCAVMGWFYCYTKVMTSDKFVYLFGRVIPSLSLVLSMILGFVPRFARQFRMVRNAQRGIGCDMTNGRLRDKMRHGFRIFSIMITWALENSVETADSMKSRGYGLPGRTAFSIYRFERRDFIALTGIFLFSAYVLIGALGGALTYWYFPMIGGNEQGIYTWTVLIAYGVLCFLPVALLRKRR
jgi:energy-coupling factor transport system permease protein